MGQFVCLLLQDDIKVHMNSSCSKVSYSNKPLPAHQIEIIIFSIQNFDSHIRIYKTAHFNPYQ